ncbi:hypothetical protein KCU99_g291, partial [Aureobasidium melanogenum]
MTDPVNIAINTSSSSDGVKSQDYHYTGSCRLPPTAGMLCRKVYTIEVVGIFGINKCFQSDREKDVHGSMVAFSRPPLGGGRNVLDTEKLRSRLHDHEAGGSSLHVSLGSEPLLTLDGCKGMLLAIDLTSDLEVIIAEWFVAVDTGETARMEFLCLLGLEVRSFDTTVAMGTQRVVELMVMVLTVWVVVNDVEISGCKGRLAGLADEAMLVVTTSQTTIRSLDGLALNRLTATSADMLRRSTGSFRRRRSGREAVLGSQGLQVTRADLFHEMYGEDGVGSGPSSQSDCRVSLQTRLVIAVAQQQ